MKHVIIAIAATILIAIGLFTATPTFAEGNNQVFLPNITAPASDSSDDEIVATRTITEERTVLMGLINEARVEHGCDVAELGAQLTVAAQAWSDIVSTPNSGYTPGHSPTDPDWYEPFGVSGGRENFAFTPTTAEDTFQMTKGSPPHWNNLIFCSEETIQTFGIGIGTDPYNGGYINWTIAIDDELIF